MKIHPKIGPPQVGKWYNFEVGLITGRGKYIGIRWDNQYAFAGQYELDLFHIFINNWEKYIREGLITRA